MSSVLLPEMYLHVVPTNKSTIRCSKCGHQPLPVNETLVQISNDSKTNSKFAPSALLLHKRTQRLNRRPERMLLNVHHFGNIRAHLRREFSSDTWSDFSTHNSTMLLTKFPAQLLTHNASHASTPAILHDTETLLLIISMTAVCTCIITIICIFKVYGFWERRTQKQIVSTGQKQDAFCYSTQS